MSAIISYSWLLIGIIIQYSLGEQFSCGGRPAGYYADVSTGCQQYHVCTGGRLQFTYSCPNTTRFQQRMMICDHEQLVDCARSEEDFGANLLLGQRGVPFVSSDEFHPQSVFKKNQVKVQKVRSDIGRPASGGSTASISRQLSTSKIAYSPPIIRKSFSSIPLTTLKWFSTTEIPKNVVSSPVTLSYSLPKPITPKFAFTSQSVNTQGNILREFPIERTTKSNRNFVTMSTPQIEESATASLQDPSEPFSRSTDNDLTPQKLRSLKDVEEASLVGINFVPRAGNPSRGKKLEWTLPDVRAMLYIPDDPADAVLPNIKRFSVTIPQPKMVFKEVNSHTSGFCPENCDPRFIEPGACHPCILIK